MIARHSWYKCFDIPTFPVTTAGSSAPCLHVSANVAVRRVSIGHINQFRDKYLFVFSLEQSRKNLNYHFFIIWLITLTANYAGSWLRHSVIFCRFICNWKVTKDLFYMFDPKRQKCIQSFLLSQLKYCTGKKLCPENWPN